MGKNEAFILALLLIFVSAGPVLSIQEQDNGLLEKLRQAFSTGSFDFMEDDFSPDFLSIIPIQQLNEIAGEFGEGLKEIEFKEVHDSTHTFEMKYGDGSSRELITVLDPDGRIVGFWIGPSIYPDAEAILKEIEELPGIVSATLLSISHDEILFSHDPDRPLAIGSAFKLYVLGELFKQIEEGKIELDDVVLLRDEDRSLPSGILQDWPSNTPLTIATLANLMISISDNTATDMLIDLVGREEIEKDLAIFGHENSGLNIPFLTTKELFKLKWALPEEEVGRYLNLSVSEKRAFLGSLYGEPLPSVEDIQGPVYIDTLEWFASSKDLTAFFKNLSEGKIVKDPELKKAMMDCLAINPVVLKENEWQYMGYKGGSEPGVISLNWIFQSEEDWFALSFIWNDHEEDVRLIKALDIAASLVNLTLT